MLRPIAAAYHAKIMESISKPYAMITRSGRCSGVPVIRRRLFGPVLGRGGRTSGSPDGTKGVRCQKQRSAGVLLAGLRPVRARQPRTAFSRIRYPDSPEIHCEFIAPRIKLRGWWQKPPSNTKV